eukprot:Filipodium_phascolosomae@DN3449_c0_g1_i1.p1
METLHNDNYDVAEHSRQEFSEAKDWRRRKNQAELETRIDNKHAQWEEKKFMHEQNEKHKRDLMDAAHQHYMDRIDEQIEREEQARRMLEEMEREESELMSTLHETQSRQMSVYSKLEKCFDPASENTIKGVAPPLPRLRV